MVMATGNSGLSSPGALRSSNLAPRTGDGQRSNTETVSSDLPPEMLEVVEKANRAIDAIATDKTIPDDGVAENYNLYYGNLPLPDTAIDEDGNDVTGETMGSQYVAPVAWEAIEAVKAAAVEAFNANRKPVEYTPPTNPGVRQANAYANTMFWEKNNGVQLIRETFERAGIAKIGVAYCAWDDSLEWEEVETTMPLAEAQQLIMSNPNIEILASQIYPVPQQLPSGQTVAIPVADLVLNVGKPRNCPKICGIDPENFGIEGTGLGQGEWTFIYHHEYVQLEELIASYPGVPEEELRRLPWDLTSTSQSVKRARDASDIAGDSHREGSTFYEKFPERIITHCFVRHGNGKIFYLLYGYGTRVVFEFEQVDDHFYMWVECFPVAGRAKGRALAEIVKYNQLAQSKAMREILNNIDLANRDRTEVDISLVDPADREKVRMISERLGGTYRVKGQGAIRHIERLRLPDETLPAMTMLQQEQESLTGYSRVAKGMNPDAISRQNAEDTVTKYAALGAKRMAMILAGAAETFLIRAYRLLYDIAIDHALELDGYEIEQDGIITTIFPSQWPQKCRASRKPCLTTEEREQRAAQLVAWDANMMQRMQVDPETKYLYQPENAAALYQEVATLQGLPVEVILNMPGSQLYQQAKQKAEAEIQRLKAAEDQQRQSEQQERAANVQAIQDKLIAETEQTLSRVDVEEDKLDLEEEKEEFSQTMDILRFRLEAEGSKLLQEEAKRAANDGGNS